MYWVDSKFLAMVSPRLDRYSIKSSNPFLAVCRCYICGDSKKDKKKTRFYFFESKGKILGHCHNCGATRGIKSLLKDFDQQLFLEYNLEIFQETNRLNPPPEPKIEHKYLTGDPNKPLKSIKKISQLKVGHAAKTYIENRKIPSSQHFRMYYAPKFCEWTNSIVPDKFKPDSEGVLRDEPRLVFPFFDKEGKMFGYQGRAIDPAAKTRYITIMVRGDFTKIFGLDQIDMDKRVYVTEGPIDSMFIPNSLAMAGSDIDIAVLDKYNTTLVFDNEPRNREICKRMNKYVENGWSICLWPETGFKDINDMVLGGYSPEQVKDIIDNHTFRGLEAKLEFSKWRKDK